MRSGTWLVWFFSTLLLGSVAFAGICSITGCDNKETILDVETPNKEVEVERDRDTGEVTVDVIDEDDGR